MGNPETVRMMTPGQFKDITAAVITQIPSDLTFDRANFLIGRKRWIGEEIARILRGIDLHAEVIAEWTTFYKKIGVEVDLAGLVIPDYVKGFDRVIVIPKGLTLNQVWPACKQLLGCKPCGAYPNGLYSDDLDSNFPINDRVPIESYAIRIRERVEADEELQNLSTDDLKEKKIAGVTLLERFVYGLKYFSETGNHLDRENRTICTGSRDYGGRIPYVHLDSDDRVHANWVCRENRDKDLRSRAVIA